MTLFRMRVVPWRALHVARVIEVSGSHTLHDLHDAIGSAFELDDDHMYAFFMNGHAWDAEHGIWSEPERGQRSAAQSLIRELALRKNRCFLYLFDFGDELMFDVRVEQISDSEPEPSRPHVVESIGKAPAQYSDSNFDEDEEEQQELHAQTQPNPALADLATRLRPHVVPWRWTLAPDDEAESTAGPGTAPEEAYALAMEVLDRTDDDFGRIHDDIEHVVEASVLGWLQHLPDALARDARAGDAVALAERLISRHAVQGVREAECRRE